MGIFIGIAVIIVGIGGLYWYLKNKDPAELEKLTGKKAKGKKK